MGYPSVAQGNTRRKNSERKKCKKYKKKKIQSLKGSTRDMRLIQGTQEDKRHKNTTNIRLSCLLEIQDYTYYKGPLYSLQYITCLPTIKPTIQLSPHFIMVKTNPPKNQPTKKLVPSIIAANTATHTNSSTPAPAPATTLAPATSTTPAPAATTTTTTPTSTTTTITSTTPANPSTTTTPAATLACTIFGPRIDLAVAVSFC
jgi:hypothetical protein